MGTSACDVFKACHKYSDTVCPYRFPPESPGGRSAARHHEDQLSAHTTARFDPRTVIDQCFRRTLSQVTV